MDKILIAHGGGGQKTTQLIQSVFQTYLDDPILTNMDDAADLGGLFFTTDTFVVNPLFFPGGDIGTLAVAGTVNDISVMGAKPKFLSIGFILEEGLDIPDLKKILSSIQTAAKKAGVRITTADTKVVERGKCDGMYINTAGIGEPYFKTQPNIADVCEGDLIIINGNIGVHEIAVLTAREEFGISTNVESDVAPLWPLIKKFKDYRVKFMRDLTRGGIAQVVNEIVNKRDFGLKLMEEQLPVTKEVNGVCEILGLDLLNLANEGKIISIVSAKDAQKVLKIMRDDPLGKGAQIVGQITKENKGMAVLETFAGSERVIMPPMGELVPRIC